MKKKNENLPALKYQNTSIDIPTFTEVKIHARRKFDEALKCLKEDERKTSKAIVGFDYCNKLFEIERNIK